MDSSVSPHLVRFDLHRGVPGRVSVLALYWNDMSSLLSNTLRSYISAMFLTVRQNQADSLCKRYRDIQRTVRTHSLALIGRNHTVIAVSWSENDASSPIIHSIATSRLRPTYGNRPAHSLLRIRNIEQARLRYTSSVGSLMDPKNVTSTFIDCARIPFLRGFWCL